MGPIRILRSMLVLSNIPFFLITAGLTYVFGWVGLIVWLTLIGINVFMRLKTDIEVRRSLARTWYGINTENT